MVGRNVQRTPQRLFNDYSYLRLAGLTTNQVVGIVLETSQAVPSPLYPRHIFSTSRQDRFVDGHSLQKASFVKSNVER
jgi:hypothetical protein